MSISAHNVLPGGTGQGTQVVKSRAQWGLGDPGSQAGRKHVWNGHGSHRKGHQVCLAGRQRREATAPAAGRWGGSCSPQLRARPQLSAQAQQAVPALSLLPGGLPRGSLPPGRLGGGRRGCTQAPDPQLATPRRPSLPHTVLSLLMQPILWEASLLRSGRSHPIPPEALPVRPGPAQPPQTHGHTDVQIQTHGHADTDTQTHRHADTDARTHMDTETDMPTQTRTHTRTHRETCRHRQTHMHTETRTDLPRGHTRMRRYTTPHRRRHPPTPP